MLHQVGDLFELNVKLRCQKVNTFLKIVADGPSTHIVADMYILETSGKFVFSDSTEFCLRYSFDYRQSFQIGKLSFSISILETKQTLVETFQGNKGLCGMNEHCNPIFG